jgi:hypothetical protein
MSGTYTSARCGGVYTKGWSDEEARAEYEATMPRAAKRGDEEAMVCDGCYQPILEWARRTGLEP